MQELQATLSNGTVIHARYVVEDMLGKGGFGAVYLVKDRRVENNRFALKEVIDPDARTRKNFTVECELLRRLDHPALPRFYSLFDDEPHSRLYLLMDYVAGQNLDNLRQRQHKKRFPLKQALRLMEPIVSAVSYLHQCEPPIIHRDIKPANIIVSASKDDTVLVDFGIAKEYNQDATTTAVRRLSPHYSAPEQYTFGTSLRTDIYGLAATLYVMLSGVVPADAFHRVIQLRTKGIDPLEPLEHLLPHLAPTVSSAIERAMSIRAEDRFASVAEFWQALQSATAHAVVDTPLAASALHTSRLASSISEPLPTLLAVNDIAEHDTEPTVLEEKDTLSDDMAQEDTVPGPTAIVEAHTDAPVTASSSDAPATTLIADHALAAPEPSHSYMTTPALSGQKAVAGQTERSRSRRLIALILGLIVMLGLVAGLLYGSISLPIKGSGFLRAIAQHPATATQVVHTTAPTTRATAAVTPTQTPRPSPAPTVHQNPTSTAAPFVTGKSYTGTVNDQSANIPAELTFTNVKQQGSTFKGTLEFSNGLTGTADFNGTMNADKSFRFIVTPYTDYLPLLFEGKVNADGSLSGTYCSERNNTCDYSSGGYGPFQLEPK